MNARSRGLAVAVIAVAIATGSIAFLLARDDDGDPRAPIPAKADPIESLPFPAPGPEGRPTSGEHVRLVDRSEVVAMFGRPSPHTIVLRVSGDVEAVIDDYAAQLGCGPGSAGGPYVNICSRKPLSFQRSGSRGASSYTLRAAETSEPGSWLALFSYSDEYSVVREEEDAIGAEDRAPLTALAVDELPFPRGDPDGYGFGDSPVQVVDGSEVLSIIPEDYGSTVVMRITGDVETVIDLYAIELGCGSDSDFEHNVNVCKRTPFQVERIGMAGSDFYAFVVEKASDGRSWVGLLSYTRG